MEKREEILTEVIADLSRKNENLEQIVVELRAELRQQKQYYRLAVQEIQK